MTCALSAQMNATHCHMRLPCAVYTHERALDGTQTQALKPAVPENESKLANRGDAEVRAMCRCAAM